MTATTIKVTGSLDYDQGLAAGLAIMQAAVEKATEVYENDPRMVRACDMVENIRAGLKQVGNRKRR